MNKFSVITSVYRNDNPQFVARALDSIYSYQTLKPNEIVITVDGPVSEKLTTLIKEYDDNNPGLFNIIWLPQNVGLGNALKVGIENAKYEIIARMDSDDVSAPDRFEKQISYLEHHPEYDLLGGQISEFIGNENNIVGNRLVPCNHSEIMACLKSRCPFNHVSIVAKRSRIIAVGNYIDWHFNEDYYLWIRMAEAGYNFSNLPDTLVNVRVGKDMYARRGGWKYFKSEKGLQDYMLKRKMISLPTYCYNVLGRFIIQVILPNKIRGFVFQKFFRK